MVCTQSFMCRRPFKMPKWKRLLPESDGGAQHGRTKRTEKGGGWGVPLGKLKGWET